MQAFVPKNRRPKFDLHLRILDLNNVPYVSGRSYIKWHLPHSGAEGHRGRTEKVPIKDHKVLYNYDVSIPIRMVIDKNGMLQELILQLDVLHEVNSGGKGERVLLGNVKLNLAEYVEPSETDGEDGVVRRYLMQDSKINSTLKVGIYTKQTDGDRNFNAPPLKVAPVFSGIAGIVAGEPDVGEDVGRGAPVMSSKAQAANDELKELYRRTIAAYWTGLPGELSADKCIEDIFNGGDGWGRIERADGTKVSGKEHPFSDDDSLQHSSHRRRGSKWSSRPRHDLKRHSKESLGKGVHNHHSTPASGIRGRGSFEQQAMEMKDEHMELGHHHHHHHHHHHNDQNEVDEMEMREDLRSWIIRSKVT